MVVPFDVEVWLFTLWLVKSQRLKKRPNTAVAMAHAHGDRDDPCPSSVKAAGTRRGPVVSLTPKCRATRLDRDAEEGSRQRILVKHHLFGHYLLDELKFN